MTITAPSARAVGNQVWVTLGGAADQGFTAGPVNLFRGRVTAPPANDDGTVENYAVLHETPGQRYGTRMGSTTSGFAGTFQVTCVGRDPEACLWTVDRITRALSGRLIEIPGLTRPRRVVEDESNRSRSVIEDRDVSPYRYYVPLLFRITA